MHILYLEEKVSIDKPSSISKPNQLHDLGQLVQDKDEKIRQLIKASIALTSVSKINPPKVPS